MKELRFTLVLKTIPVVLENEDGETAYVLKELTGAQRDQYLTRQNSKMIYTDGKPTGLKSFDGVQSYLLSLCLYEALTEKLVLIKAINKFPSAVQTALHEAAQKLSALEDDEAEELGND